MHSSQNSLQTYLPTRDVALILLVVSLWGISFTIIKLGLAHLPPFLFSALRFSLAALPAIFLVRFPKQYWRQVVLVGLLLGVAKFSCLFFALDGHITAGMASVLLQSQVFMTILFSAWLFKEGLQKTEMIGLGLATIGFFVLLLSGSTFTPTGLCLILLAGLFWTLSNMIMKTLKDIDLLSFMVWVCAIPPIPLFLISWWTETQEPWQLITSTSWSGWLAVLFLSYFSTILAYGLWGSLLSKHAAAKITPFALLIPVVGILVAYLALNESMSLYDGYSTILIVLGLVFCVLGKRLSLLFLRKPKKETEMNAL